MLGNLGNAALQLGDDDAQQRFYTLALSRARERGAVMAVRLRAAAAVLRPPRSPATGLAVRSSAEEALALAPSIGQRALTAPPLAWLTLLAALQGRDDYDELLPATSTRSSRPTRWAS